MPFVIMEVGRYVTDDRRVAIITRIGDDGRAYGNMPGNYDRTWWYANTGEHAICPIDDLVARDDRPRHARRLRKTSVTREDAMPSGRNERNFETRPYSLDELRVVKWLQSRVPDIGGGDDPIGFLLVSYELLHMENEELRKLKPQSE